MFLASQRQSSVMFRSTKIDCWTVSPLDNPQEKRYQWVLCSRSQAPRTNLRTLHHSVSGRWSWSVVPSHLPSLSKFGVTKRCGRSASLHVQSNKCDSDVTPTLEVSCNTPPPGHNWRGQLFHIAAFVSPDFTSHLVHTISHAWTVIYIYIWSPTELWKKKRST